MAFRIGDRCRDNNRNWPNYGKTGTVVSIRNDKITWRSDKDGQLVTDARTELKKETNRKMRNVTATFNP